MLAKHSIRRRGPGGGRLPSVSAQTCLCAEREARRAEDQAPWMPVPSQIGQGF